MKPVAIDGSIYVCPQVTGTVAHVGGTVTATGKVRVNGKAIAICGCSGSCCAGSPNHVKEGSAKVYVQGKQRVAVVGDSMEHGGVIVSGAVKVRAA